MKKFFLALFMLFAVAQLVAARFNLPLLHTFSKPLIVPALMGYYIYSYTGRPRSIAFMLALFFCWVGDVLLMFQSQFIMGLLAFLIGHLLYIATWRHHRNPADQNTLSSLQQVRMALPIILYATGMVVVLYPHLGNLRIAVLLYAAVLGYMVLQALFRYGGTNGASFAYVLGGSVLFMVSDSILAFDRFIQPVQYGHFWIMLTYMAAQFMLVKGIVRHEFAAD
jgi:uncharacterized membrane protein YhhN